MMELIMGGDDDFDFSDVMEKCAPFAAQTTGDVTFGAGRKQPTTCGLIDYDSFDVRPGKINDTWFLFVRGTTPTISMRVSLCPCIYVDQPEYWGIEVVGCLPPIVLPAKGTFAEVLDVTNFMGKKGLEVIGATKSDRWQKP